MQGHRTAAIACGDREPRGSTPHATGFGPTGLELERGSDILGHLGIGRAELYDAFLLKGEEVPRILAFFEWWSGECGLDPPRGRLLDVGCGTGRLLEGFARRWGGVVGMEPDRDYWARASDRARSRSSVEVRHGGFNDIEFEEEFDLVVSVNGPFFYLLTPRERREALFRVHRALKPGGAAFFDLANFPYLLRTYDEGALPVARRRIGGRWATRKSEHVFDFHNAIWEHRDTFEFSAVLPGSDVAGVGSLPARKDRSGSKAEPDAAAETPIEEYGTPPVAIHFETFRFAIITPPEIFDGLINLGFGDLCTFNGWDSRESELLSGPRIMLSARKGWGV